MLTRKYSERLEEYLSSRNGKVLLLDGARQIGKSYIVRYVGKKLFKYYVEINLKEDAEGDGIFAKVRSIQDFYLQLGAIAGKHLGNREDTLVFLDEIQSYPHLLTMLKFLCQDGRYAYIASGSQLGVVLAQTPSVPLGSVDIEEMYPLDFEEFLWAMGCGADVIDKVRSSFHKRESVPLPLHEYLMRQFKTYLLVGGMPESINTFLATRNIADVRRVQTSIHELYKIDASQYDQQKRLVIRRVYDMIPSNLENKKKRVVIKNIEGRSGHRQFADYVDEFEYLIESGIALSVRAIANPRFPLVESEQKNLLKLYLNDVGLLTNVLYGLNINAVLNDEKSINLGTVYESLVAQELCAHGHTLHYFDNKKCGEVDFLVDDYDRLSVLPIEVKSGKDYRVHSALTGFIETEEYGIKSAIVFSNEREVICKDGIQYLPIYYSMFVKPNNQSQSATFIPPIPIPEV